MSLVKALGSLRFGALLAGVSLLMSVHATSSYAIAGIASADPLLALGGLVLGTGGFFGASVIQSQGTPLPPDRSGFCNPNGSHDSEFRENLCGAGFFGAVTVMFAGLVVLDDSGSYNLTFSALNADQAAALGISSEQLLAFNSNIDEINAVAENVVAKVSSDLNSGESQQSTVTDARKLWDEYKLDLNPSAFEVMQKLAKSYFLQK